jgi:hypothetical protein
VKGKDGKARDARHRGRKPRHFHSLDADTTALLGDHEIIWERTQMVGLSKLLPDQRLAVVQLMPDGKAKNVRDAKAILDPPEPYGAACGATLVAPDLLAGCCPNSIRNCLREIS